MNDLRIKVAKLLGWTAIGRPPEYNGLIGRPPNVSAPYKDAMIPNYPEDLNACHNMEGSMNDEQYQGFVRHLYKIVTGKRMMRTDCVALMVKAKARQRCEAFVITMGRDDAESAY